MARRLFVGWGFGTLVSVLGMVVLAVLDLPTGAAVVCTFGLTLLVFALLLRRLAPLTGGTALGAAPLGARKTP